MGLKTKLLCIISYTVLATTIKELFSSAKYKKSWTQTFQCYLKIICLILIVYPTTMHGISYLSHDYAWDIIFIPRLCMGYHINPTTMHGVSYLSHDCAWGIIFTPRLCMGYHIYPTTMHGISYLPHDYAWDIIFIPRLCMGYHIYPTTAWDTIIIPRICMGYHIYPTTMHGMGRLNSITVIVSQCDTIPESYSVYQLVKHYFQTIVILFIIFVIWIR